MAKSAPPLSAEARDKKETELVRLRKMRASLPPDKKAAGRQIDRRVSELEAALKASKSRSIGINPLKLVLFGLVAIVGLALGFVGMITAGHMLQP